MQRSALKRLLKWKVSASRKPLIIRGIRQVGKTWLMKEFGEKEYEQCAYINFESNKLLKDIFVQDYDIKRILKALEIQTEIKINPANTLIIFDEIQEAEGAITSLKYFVENAPEYHILSAGSLLGVSLHRKTSFPVGKVEFLDLYPLNFTEYLEAAGQENLLGLLHEKDWELVRQFKQKYIEHLRQYYFIGGMPEPVYQFTVNNDFDEVRSIQKRILASYEQDFSKYAPYAIVPRIRMLWNSIPAQMAKENRKFIYGVIQQGARAKEYEHALSWLVDCGLVHKVHRVSKPAIPLNAYEDLKTFKLFFADIGLLGAICDIDVKILLKGSSIFEEFKGVISEQFVLQQLIAASGLNPFYWSSEKSTAEIDFLLQYQDKLIPVEVKSEENLQAKSLKFFVEKFKPALAIRTSMSDYREEEWLVNIPLYAICGLQDFIK